MERDISLAIVPRNNNDPVNNASGNHALAPAEIDKPKWNPTMNKYVQSAMTAHPNKGPRIGSPILPMSKTTSKNSSCNKYWEQKDRIFKALKPDSLGESYSL